MPTLRELRKQAKDLGISYEKDTTPEQLQEMIVEQLCATENPVAPPIHPVREPITDPAPEDHVPDESELLDTTDSKSFFTDEIQINEGDLNTEFVNQAAKYANFAQVEANAKAKVMTAKLRLEVVDSEMTKKIRERLTVDLGKAPTEKMVSSEVITSIEYQAAQKALIKATRDADIAKGMKEAFGQRKDMLIQLGSAKRQEVDQIGMGLREKAKEIVGKAA